VDGAADGVEAVTGLLAAADGHSHADGDAGLVGLADRGARVGGVVRLYIGALLSTWRLRQYSLLVGPISTIKWVPFRLTKTTCAAGPYPRSWKITLGIPRADTTIEMVRKRVPLPR